MNFKKSFIGSAPDSQIRHNIFLAKSFYVKSKQLRDTLFSVRGIYFGQTNFELVKYKIN